MRDGRWITVTESEFQHEQRGLDAIRHRLPDSEPWRAWSNFTFTAASGHVREVDLLVISPAGVFLIELKDWHGTVESTNGTWLQTRPGPGGQQIAHTNPLHLANKKAKELAGRLAEHGERVWVAEAVCFTAPDLTYRLAVHDQQGVHTVVRLAEMLKQPPHDERRRINATRSREIARALKRIGIKPSDAEYQVGPYRLKGKSFDSGPTWADYLAHHSELPETARIRIYLPEHGADAALRESVERGARREADVLRRFRHPGVVQLKQYDPSGHSAGPALIFDFDPRTLRLDQYLTQYGEKIDILSRIAMVRQLAEVMRFAHGRHIYHRTLAARAVHVVPRGRGRAAGREAAEAGWLNPHLQIADWQIAAQRGAEHTGTAGKSGGKLSALTSFSQAAAHLAEGADPYLAPELTALKPDPVALDVYGLGVLTYLLATGKAPAASQAELLTRFDAGEGLRPSAVVDGLSEYIDELVQAATAYRVKDRVASVAEFLDMLEVVEEALTEPSSLPADTTEPAAPQQPTVPEPRAAEPEKRPADLVAGDLLDGRWEIKRRIGTGSTSRAFLARDVEAKDSRFAHSHVVLKVALKNQNAVLDREFEVMERLRPDSRIIQLVEPKRLRIADTVILVMEYVGDQREEDPAADASGVPRPRRREETVARLLRERGRLSVDQLEAYGDYLFGAVDFLEGEGVWHRDIKPDNIAIRVRPNRTRELVLIDFSLADLQAQKPGAGTPGYHDPFIGTMDRSVYDAQAERYAIAVTLYEMASGELPEWGGGAVHPRQTDPELEPYPKIVDDAFDPAVKEALVVFFQRALHRNAGQRFSDLKPMRDAWKKIFLDMTEAKPPSRRSRSVIPASDDDSGENAPAAEPAIEDAEEESAGEQRDRAAAAADRGTPIPSSGLSPAAQSFVHGLGVHDVGQLLDYSERQLVNAPGLGHKTHKEVLKRIKEWHQRLTDRPSTPLTPEGRKAAKRELDELSNVEATLATELAATGSAGALPGRAWRGVSLDALATLFVPALRKDGTNRDEYEVVRRLLRLPDEQGSLPGNGVWPGQKDVAEKLGLPTNVVSEILKKQRARWAGKPPVRELRAEILELLRGMGRLASAAEIADALAVRHGTQLAKREQRRALALAAVRAAVELEQGDPETAQFQHVANPEATDQGMSAGLLALRAGGDEPEGTPSGEGLLGYAQRLGQVADHLALLDTLPNASYVLGELGLVTPPPEENVEWDDRRLVEVAAAASRTAAVTPRLEIYPRDLPLVRALRLTQAGLVRLISGVPLKVQPGLTPQEVHERVRARFPELLDERGGYELPVGTPLTKALREAGFDLVLATRKSTGTVRYLPRLSPSETSYLSAGGRGRPAGTLRAQIFSDHPPLADAASAEERLRASARRDGFRVLTVRTGRLEEAVAVLTGDRFGAGVVSVTELFLGALHEQVDPRPKPTWETILRADAAPAGSKAALKFAEYARTAWGAVESRLGGLVSAASGDRVPLLLTDGGAFARYDAMGTLEHLAERARAGGRAVWLLCPQDDPARPPRLGRIAVPYQAGFGEWIVLPDSWLDEADRIAALSGGGR